MKKKEIYEGRVESVSFPNKGMVKVDGNRVTVKNTLPGQQVRFQINKFHKGKAEARLLEVLEKAPQELDQPACAHFGQCGGCNYQNLPYEEQLALKEKQIKGLFQDVLAQGGSGSFDDLFEGIKHSPNQFHYRNKMEFTFGDEYKDGPLSLGMHKRGGFYDIVTVGDCAIIDEDFKKILLATLEFFKDREIPYYHRMRHTGFLRHLLVRRGEKTGEIMVDLITAHALGETWSVTGKDSRSYSLMAGSDGVNGLAQEPQDTVAPSVLKLIDETPVNVDRPTISERDHLLADYIDTLCKLDLKNHLAGILNTKNDNLADTIQDQGTDILYGQDYFYEELLGLKFKVTPFSFFQTNSLGAEVLYDTAREFIGDISGIREDGQKPVLFDLYSGTGTIAQMMAPAASKVIGVEIVEEAVEAARINASEINGLTNCEFIADDVLKALDYIEEKPDYIILDPPRDGIHPKALEHIIDYGVDRMIYISCKPTSLARDLVMLQECGYRVERMCCVDMFPGTVHVETVCLLD